MMGIVFMYLGKKYGLNGNSKHSPKSKKSKPVKSPKKGRLNSDALALLGEPPNSSDRLAVPHHQHSLGRGVLGGVLGLPRG